MKKCCERDHNNHGNCHIHAAPGVLRIQHKGMGDFIDELRTCGY